MNTRRHTHCKCGLERNEDFKGNRCLSCWKEYSKNYYQTNKARLNLLQKESRKNVLESLPKPPRPLKTFKKLTQEEVKKRHREKSYDYYHTVVKPRKLCKERKVESIRKPITPNPDRELYCDNDTFPLLTYYMDFSWIRECPMEHLTYEHWESRQELEDSIRSPYGLKDCADLLMKVMKICSRRQ